MMKNLTLFALLLTSLFSLQAQTADEIVDNYFEAVGGKEKMAAIELSTYTGVAIQIMGPQSMEFPFTMYQKAPNKQRLDISFQGQTMTQMCFDGKEGWGVNFMNMKPEKYTEEDNALTAAESDFPSPLIGYKEKGYKLTLDGEEEIQGTACHKVKLTKQPVKINGEEQENVSYYFFDKETGVMIMSRTYQLKGPMAGKAQETHFSDYEEVDGIYYPHTMEIYMDGQKGFEMRMEGIDTETDIPESTFAYPEEAEAPAKDAMEAVPTKDGE